MRKIRSKLLVPFTTMGTVAGLALGLGIAFSGPANAGNYYTGVVPGNYYGQQLPPSSVPGYAPRHKMPRQYGHKRKHRHGYSRRYRQPFHYQPDRICRPRRALNRAYNLGLDNPQVQRVRERRIVITGYQYGYRTKMVFKRHSNCQVIKTVRFGW